MNAPKPRRRALVAAAIGLLSGTAALAGPASCYRAIGADSPGPRGATVVLIDTTTVADSRALSSLRTLVVKALNRPGERVLVASFAGTTPGQLPVVLADVFHEPEPSAVLVESNVLDWTLALRSCLGKLRRANVQAVDTALRSAVAKDLRAPYSEIVTALRWALVDLIPRLGAGSSGAPAKLIIYSDGEQNSRSGTTFYRRGLPREISAPAELARVESDEAGRGFAGSGRVDVWWVGLGLQPPGITAYLVPRALEERTLFWSGVSKLFGARIAAIGLAPIDDGF